MWVDLSKWAEHECVCVPYECSPKRYLKRAREIIRKSGWLVLQNSVGFFPQLSLSLFGQLMDKVAKAAELKIIRGLSDIDFHAATLTGPQHSGFPHLPAVRGTFGLQQGVIAQRISQPCCQIGFVGLLLLQKGQHLFSREYNLTLDTNLPFLLLPKPLSVHFKNPSSSSWQSIQHHFQPRASSCCSRQSMTVGFCSCGSL